jgi:branched-chain amino acid aminotransferase
MKIACIIPARGGSKGIPNKNIIEFCGKPLISHTILNAKNSNLISEVFVTSDSDEILNISSDYGATPIKRPEGISGDFASSEDAILHSIENISQDFDTIVFLQVTSPLRETSDIDRMINDYVNNNYDSMFSSCELEDFLMWEKKDDLLKSLNYDFLNRKRRQDHNPQIVENGSMYIFNKNGFIENKNRLFGKIGTVTQESWKMFEIDNYEDLDFCSYLYKKHFLSTGRKVFMNGDYVNEMDAKISIYDSALMFGDMVFEMTRSFNKKQFKLEEHIDRLLNGVKILRIPLQYTKEELIDICNKVIEINEPLFLPTDEHRLVINISRGPLGLYSHLFDKVGATVIVADFPLKWTVSGMGKLFDEGINAVVTNQKAIPNHLLDPKIKNRSRLHYQMANIEASQFKGENNWALLLDEDGFIAEGSGDNVFFVKDGVVYTPEGRNILRGISRDYIFELCDELGIPCVEKNLTLYDAYTSDESFMTATPFCILPVKSVNYIDFGDGKMGPITKRLLDKWSDNVGVDIEQQIKDFNNEFIIDSKVSTPYNFKK